jgi:hypothetical protein
MYKVYDDGEGNPNIAKVEDGVETEICANEGFYTLQNDDWKEAEKLVELANLGIVLSIK